MNTVRFASTFLLKIGQPAEKSVRQDPRPSDMSNKELVTSILSDYISSMRDSRPGDDAKIYGTKRDDALVIKTVSLEREPHGPTSPDGQIAEAIEVIGRYHQVPLQVYYHPAHDDTVATSLPGRVSNGEFDSLLDGGWIA